MSQQETITRKEISAIADISTFTILVCEQRGREILAGSMEDPKTKRSEFSKDLVKARVEFSNHPVLYWKAEIITALKKAGLVRQACQA